MMKRKMMRMALCLVCILLVLSGCDRKKTDKKELKKGYLYIYYMNADENGFSPVEYKPGETETLKIIKELVHKLSDSNSIGKETYKKAIPDDVIINSVLLEDKTVTIDFGSSYEQQTPDREILCRGAVVKTLTQLDEVNSVQFSVDGTPLSNNTISIGAMEADDFMASEEEIYNVSAQVSLYYTNHTGDKLIEVVEKVSAKDNVSLEQAALQALQRVPEKEEGKVFSPLPAGLMIQKVQIYDNICYVSLSEDIVSSVSQVNDEIMVYSMVNTIIGMGKVNSVQFTVNGEKVKTIHEFDKFDQVMTFNYSVCDYAN